MESSSRGPPQTLSNNVVSVSNAGSKREKDAQFTEVVVSDRGFQLAKGWLRNMTGGDDEDETENDLGEMETRPARLGLGAKYLPHSQATCAMSALKKRLAAKIPHSKQGKYQNGNASTAYKTKLNSVETTDEGRQEEKEDFGDSRASAFQKKERQDKLLLIDDARNTKRKKR